VELNPRFPIRVKRVRQPRGAPRPPFPEGWALKGVIKLQKIQFQKEVFKAIPGPPILSGIMIIEGNGLNPGGNSWLFQKVKKANRRMPKIKVGLIFKEQ